MHVGWRRGWTAFSTSVTSRRFRSVVKSRHEPDRTRLVSRRGVSAFIVDERERDSPHKTAKCDHGVEERQKLLVEDVLWEGERTR